MVEGNQTPLLPLRGDEALAWFVRHRRGGGQILDAALMALQEFFGSDVTYRFVAPVDPNSGSPIRLVVEIQQPVDSESAWEHLIEAQSRLLEQTAALRQRMRVRDPFDRFVLTLSEPPRDWSALLTRVDRID